MKKKSVSVNKQQESPKKQQPKIEDKSSSEEEVNFDADSPNQKFFNLADVKPLDLKSQWLGNTHQVLSKFDQKMEELKKEKQIMKEGFQKFAQNQHKFRISSLRKIHFQFDKKTLYREFMKKSRVAIEKLHPSLVIIIYSYIEANVFLAMTKMRRVSQIFNFIYKNQQIEGLFSFRDFGSPDVPLSTQVKWCQRYVNFRQTFLYYKELKYTILIPQNSIKQDLEQAISFITEIYKRVYKIKSLQIGYFQLVNKFMIAHRAAMALQSLSFADLAVTRRASVITFSNYLALNPPARLKQQITKTKYLKMIELVEGQDSHDALVINSKISNFLIQEYNYQLGAFVDTTKSVLTIQFTEDAVFDLVVFHYHNPLKSFLEREVTEKTRMQFSETTLEFSQDFKGCRFTYQFGEAWQSEYLLHNYLPVIKEKGKFGHCYVFKGEVYYILLIKVESEESNQIF